MSTIAGLPAHVLLVHFVVVLIPLTALLAVLCAVWPAARRHLVWLVAALAVAVAAITPVTTEAGEWLEHRSGPSEAVHVHAELGDTMPYFAVGLVVAAALLVAVHLLDRRGRTLPAIAAVVVAVVVVAASAAAVIQVYRVGDSGARSAWGSEAGAADGGD